MKIEVDYNELYKLSDYLESASEQLKLDQEFINSLSESLNQVLHGAAEQAISSRIKNFNTTQFSKIVNYTKVLAGELKNTAKIYNSEEDEFELKMKNEASKYATVDK